MKQLTDFFSDKAVNTVLDVGTGSGDFIPAIKSAFPGADITGIDPNLDSLRSAKQKYPGVVFSEMVGECLGFGDNGFDAVCISMALHHLPNVQETLAEMRRVAKPGGWIVVSELFSDNLEPAQEVHKMFHHFRSSIDRVLGISHNETFKRQEILREVEESGIKVISHFDFKKGVNLVSTPQELEARVAKMREMLATIKGSAEHGLLEPQIELFRKSAEKHGFLPATRLVVIGKV